MAATRLYLDNAATSFPKPRGVYEAMLRYGTEVGGTAGRGAYFEAREGGRLIRQCRDRINKLLHGEDPDQVVFTLNTTDALNLAIKGVVRRAVQASGGKGKSVHVVATALDHNSVLRPLNSLAAEDPRVSWTCVGLEGWTASPASVAAAVRADTVLVSINHVSNVTGAVQPVKEIAAACRRVNPGVLVLLDAAQSAGHTQVDVRELGVDLVALPGHKGLLGPLGTGALYIRPGAERVVAPLREGGTGSRSEQDRQPESLPDKYESGSQNAVGIVGLSEGVRYLLERGVEELEAHERELRAAMLEGLSELGAVDEGGASGRMGLRLVGPATVDGRTGVFSMVHEALSPQELAAILEQEHGVLGRAGLSCAPRVHEGMGTTAGGGVFRLSVGPFTTVGEVRRACAALGDVCRAVVGRV